MPRIIQLSIGIDAMAIVVVFGGLFYSTAVDVVFEGNRWIPDAAKQLAEGVNAKKIQKEHAHSAQYNNIL